MLKTVILGSTGNLGCQALEVLEKYREYVQIVGICANKREELLQKQAVEWSVANENVILASKKPIDALAKLKEADIVINVLSGFSGIKPTEDALKEGKILILGNKESLVANGYSLSKNNIKKIIPLDSEHNAIHEILKKTLPTVYPHGKWQKKIKRIILPCSGGPLFGKTKKEIRRATLGDILNHPRWTMGPKITVESALWLNKGLEIIEAHYLFGLPLEKIDILVHLDCLAHGIVEFKDGKLIAYISAPDMREHIENTIQEALSGKEVRLKQPGSSHFGPSPREIRQINLNEFSFHGPDYDLFPGLKIILKTFKKDSKKMAEFLKREERLIYKLLNKKISIPKLIKSLREISV